MLIAVLIAVLVAVLAPSQALPADSQSLPEPLSRKIEFEADVLPILKAHCLDCHGHDDPEADLILTSKRSLLRGGESGEPAILPQKSADSFLIKVVSGAEPKLKMPPDGPRLSAVEIATLRAWIDQGLVMPFEAEPAVDDERSSHWSFQPVSKAAPPELNSDFVTNGIDAFILQTLNDHDLKPSPRADRRTLIRRLFLVMLGLPPTLEQVDNFVNDQRPDAWQRLVDDVLDSPHYGERWARHWLDLIRFGETHGFETNRERPNAWPYRDWVIAALNNDKPYDAFIREQIAGDALGEPIATSFLVAGPHDIVKSPDINLTLMQRQDELSDMINTTSTAFLGLTLGCARCHNHKFDPITQSDFYSVQAIFAGVNHADRALPVTDDRKLQLAAVDLKLEDLRSKLADFIPSAGSGFTLLDDETLAASGTPGLELLVEPHGHGTNPAGRERGFASDPGSHAHMTNISGGRYTWWQNSPGVNVAAYRPLARGTFRVWLSWGAGYDSHTQDAVYILDRDGDLNTTTDQQELAVVDQQRFAVNDGSAVDSSVPPAKNALWSGLLNVGIHTLEPSNVIVLRGGKTGSAITADVLVLEGVPTDVTERGSPLRPGFRPAVTVTHNVDQFSPTEARFIRFTILATNSSQPCIDELEVFSGAKNVALASHGSQATSSSSLPGYPIHKLEHVNDGRFGNTRSWISNESGAGWVQIEFPNIERIDRVEWARDRDGRFADRVATRYRIETSVEPGQWQLVASSDDRLPFGNAESTAPLYRFDTSTPERAEQGQRWLAELEAAQRERDRLSTTPTVYAGTFSQPGPTHRLYRGEPLQKREEVAPGAITFIKPLTLQNDTPEQQRRLAFANWVATPENPLTSRVIVNRLWQFQFGSGLVTTPSDFGANGTKPSHPELLDWLATELVTHGWSLKHIQRLILLSNTWQQDSRPNVESMKVDAGARLIWRFPPRRLEAESMRDSILSVSGKLNLKSGGPGFSGFEVEMENVRHFHPKNTFTDDDFRRMIYMTKVRQEQDSVFGAFDCPDASQVMPTRSRSTTPLQAFNLLNSAFVLEQSGFLAARLATAGDETAAVKLAFNLCFSRLPDADELALSLDFIRNTSMKDFTRAMLNSSEFLFIP
jgi:hypothetical protein